MNFIGGVYDHSRLFRTAVPADQVSSLDWIFIAKYVFIQVIVFYLAGIALGLWKLRSGVHVSITRKLFCMIFFTVSFIVPRILSAGHLNKELFISITTVVTIGLILSLKLKAFRLIFECISREGEHEHTIRWLTTESLVTGVIIWLGTSFIPSSPALFLLPAFASGLSDSAAEIVGTRWGKHRYKTIGFFAKGPFHRTLEGSAAFFAVTFLFTLYIASGLIPFSFIFVFPLALTLAEAIAPHTWDNPLIYGVGYLVLSGYAALT